MTDLRNAVAAETWDRVAPGWDRYRRHVADQKAPVTERLLAVVEPRPGDSVLELGAGPGDLALELSDLVGPDGTVVATDVSSAMVALAARALTGRPGTRAQLADAADLGDIGDGYDAVVCRMGLMFLTEPAAGLAEAHRVLRADGRLGIAVWAGPEHNPWLTTVGMASMGLGLPVALPFGPGGPFSLGDPGALEQMLREVGFRDVRIDAVDFQFHFDDAEMHVRTNGALAPNLAEAFAAATPDQLEALVGAVADADTAYEVDGELRVPARALVAGGRR